MLDWKEYWGVKSSRVDVHCTNRLNFYIENIPSTVLALYFDQGSGVAEGDFFLLVSTFFETKFCLWLDALGCVVWRHDEIWRFRRCIFGCIASVNDGRNLFFANSVDKVIRRWFHVYVFCHCLGRLQEFRYTGSCQLLSFQVKWEHP